MEQNEVLCIYGIDEDHVSLNAWIKKKKGYVVFIEDDLNVDTKSHSFFKHPNVFVYNLKSILEIDHIIKQIAWQFVFLTITLQCSKKYQTSKIGIFQAIQSSYEHIINGVHLSASSFSDHGLDKYWNIYSNIYRNQSFHCLQGMQDCFKQIPIVICGAGPSLDQSIPVLKQLDGQAIIFAGGAAISALEKYKISPHLMANVDPLAPKMNIKENIPYFFPWTVRRENLPGKACPKVLCSGKDPYLFDKWLEGELQLSFDHLNMGWTVTTFMTSLAIYFGCNPIIFVGNDLAIEKNKMYSTKASGKHIRHKSNQTYIFTADKSGKLVRTQKDWKMAADWLKNMFEKRKDISFFNGRKSGIDLGENISYLDINEILSWKKHCLNKTISSLFMEQPLTDISVDHVFSKIYLEMVQKLNWCNEAIKRLEKQWNLQQYEIKEESIQNSWVDQYLLNPLWQIFKYLYIRNINKDNFFSFKLELYKTLFFKDVLEKHIKLVENFHASLEVSNSK